MGDGSDYFTLAERFLPETTVRSAPVNSGFDGVQAGFAKLPTEAELKRSVPNVGTDSGTADTYVITSVYPFATLAINDVIRFRAAHANTGPATINRDGGGFVSVTRTNGDALQAGDIPLFGLTEAFYDGTAWRLQGSSAADSAAAHASALAAAASAAASAASAVAAANFAAALVGTATDSRTVGTGSRTFNTQTGKQWATGERLRAATVDGLNGMDGQVLSYTGGALVIGVDYIFGTGTFASWVISLIGPVGPKGDQGAPGAGTGDVVAANNGSEFADKDALLSNIGGTMVGRSIFKAADAAAVRTAAGLGTAATSAATAFQSADADLTALAGLTTAADRLPYFTGAGAAALAVFTAYARTLAALSSKAAVQAELGITTSAGSPGDLKHTFALVAPSGWVLLDGRTIGDAASGATNRANADTSALFTVLWALADAQCPVSGGRGVSAAADFAAHKTITLPSGRGRALIGKDDMGGTAANLITAGGSGINGTILGLQAGAETNTLTTAQLPVFHVTYKSIGSGSGIASGTSFAKDADTNNSSSVGTGAPHPNVQPILITNILVKL